MSLNGKATSTGDSIIMPSDISTLATTMSITRNGMKITKPMMKAIRSSERMNAGISVALLTSSTVVGLASFDALIIILSSRLPVCLSMNVRIGTMAFL